MWYVCIAPIPCCRLVCGALHKFVRSCADVPPLLYGAYLTMLRGLARSSQGALQVYRTLETNGKLFCSVMLWLFLHGTVGIFGGSTFLVRVSVCVSLSE